MPTNTEICANWKEHVILSCPNIETMEDFVETIGTADAQWVELEAETVSWMDSLTGSLAEFMGEDESKAFILRLIRFFYIEAMTAGQTYHQSTAALLDRPPGNREKWNSVCAAMVAGALRISFEGVCNVGMQCFYDDMKKADIVPARVPAPVPIVAVAAGIAPDSGKAPVMQAAQVN